MSHLVSNYQLSRREVKAFLKEQYNFPISLGTLFNKQKTVSAALATPTAELLGAAKKNLSVSRRNRAPSLWKETMDVVCRISYNSLFLDCEFSWQKDTEITDGRL